MASTEQTAGEGEAHAGTEALGGAASDVFPPFDATTFPSQLLWLAITFVALYYLMARVALPRIAGILESRRDRIASDLDTAQRLKTDSDEAIKAYEQALNDARGKASTIGESARQEARQVADEKRAAIEEELAVKLTAAEQRIADIKSQAQREVGAIATEAAGLIVGKLTSLDVSAEEAGAAVEAALRENEHAV